MQLVKVISEHKKTKRVGHISRDGDGGSHVETQHDKFHSKVGFIEAIVTNSSGYLYTAHVPDPRPKKKERPNE